MSNTIAKKVGEYFKFIQDNLRQNYGPEIKTPIQIKDKKERDNFFAQVKKLWDDKHKKAKVQSKLEQISGSGKVILLGDLDGVIQGPRGEKDWYYFLAEDAEGSLKKGDEVVFDIKKEKTHAHAVNVKKA